MIAINFEVYKNLENYKEITSGNTYASLKHDIFDPEGVYSEQIFGPVNNNRCQCGQTFGKINIGKRCENCGVICGSSELRLTTFAKIKLPDGIYVVNPDFQETLGKLLGSHAINKILDVRYFNENKINPYYFSLEKMKLMKASKLKKDEKIYEKEIFDITTLKELFDYLITLDDVKNYFVSNIFNEEIINYFFLNEIPVIPPNSRPLIKINGNMTVVHEISNLYIKLFVSKKNLSDALFQKNSNMFGYTVYKYQKKINEIYETILENNFKKKESYLRESLTGKTIEFSARAVIVPNPAIKPYSIGLHKETVQKIFLPEMLHYFYQKYSNEKIDGYDLSPIEFLQRISKLIDTEDIDINDKDFIEFLKEYGSKFKAIIERQPVLFKYNTSGVQIERVFSDNDIT